MLCGWKGDDWKKDKTLQKLTEGEPFFVLRAQDVLAPIVISVWRKLAMLRGISAAKNREAQMCQGQMETWPGRKYPD